MIQILAENPDKPLSVVKDYVISALQEEDAVIKADEKNVEQLQQDTAKMRADIEELQTK